MKKLILASNNQNKIKEIKEILNGLNIEVLSLKDKNIDIDVEEDGKTFEDNAVKKAVEIYKVLKENNEENFYVLADDSGLEVDYLNGEPGVYSARYSGVHGNDYENNVKLLKEMKDAEGEERIATFICVLALVDENNNVNIIKAGVEGEIIKELKTEGGFGYDPLFYYHPFKKTFGEASSEEKNSVSHRGKALNALKKLISEY